MLLGLLLLGTLPSFSLRFIAISHLLSLWLYAGLNTLVSPAFVTGGAGWMLGGLGANEITRHLLYRPFTQIELLKGTFGYVVLASEILLAALAMHPRTRGWCAALALVAHTGILLVLSPLGNNANEVVWPWNVALAFAGALLILPWKERLRASFQRSRWPAWAVAVTIWLYPLGYYAGVSDAYLSHSLYTGNTLTESWCAPGGACLPGSQAGATWGAVNVPMPPERRLYEAYFQALCKPSERLITTDRRPLAEWRGARQQEVACQRL